MLYEGAIKLQSCNRRVEEKDIQKAHTNIIKVERIIEEFQPHWIINIRLRKTLTRFILIS